MHLSLLSLSKTSSCYLTKSGLACCEWSPLWSSFFFSYCLFTINSPFLQVVSRFGAFGMLFFLQTYKWLRVAFTSVFSSVIIHFIFSVLSALQLIFLFCVCVSKYANRVWQECTLHFTHTRTRKLLHFQSKKLFQLGLAIIHIQLY